MRIDARDLLRLCRWMTPHEAAGLSLEQAAVLLALDEREG